MIDRDVAVPTDAAPPRVDAAASARPCAAWLARQRALAIDVETLPHEDQRIFAFGARRTDSGAAYASPRGRDALGAEAQLRLAALADGAELLVGHNLRHHDLPLLARQCPRSNLTSLAVVDTLEWSALAFPVNPYHRLVKGYKLLTEARNDPLADADAALALWADEIDAFARMHTADSRWVALLHHLRADDAPLADCLVHLRGRAAPTAAEATVLAREAFDGRVCAQALARHATFDEDAAPVDDATRQALAYALGWVRVAGGASVLPRWVAHEFPRVPTLIAALREHDCGDAGCRWCRTQHHPETLLRRHFDKPSFRATPAAPDGGSLQRAIVVAGLQRRSVLAVLPTGGGKSIGFQLPALVHHLRAGRLTVVVSPLQSLMKDQVDNLVALGAGSAVTINGLLTPLERRAALERVRLGDAALVFVSPEQFRSRSFVDALRLRDIAAWVFDEAHCLSKWGHDFRTDYLYVARFVREHFAAAGPATVACFTATAKPDVIDDIRAHFRDQLELELEPMLGGHARANLSYDVIPTTKAQKAQRVVELLQAGLAEDGAAIVFCATRRHAQDFADLLNARGITCGCFHGGLEPEAKKAIQQRFLDRDPAQALRVIAATNAFGMGVDKPDVRLVVHADIPGSLENYLQEAGRAGRDGAPARCVLLFDPDDVETQFRLAATSQLTARDVGGLLKTIRQRAARLKRDEVVVSARELLAQAGDAAPSIDIDRQDAATKVATAISWLERGGFVRRDENATRVFPTSLRLPTVAAAVAKLQRADLVPAVLQRFLAVVRALFAQTSPEGLSTDDLMLEAGLAPHETFRILHGLEQLGIVANDLGLTVRVSKGVRGASDLAFAHLVRLEEALLALMAEHAPEAAGLDTPQPLPLRAACTELRRRLGLGDDDSRVHPGAVRACLRALGARFADAPRSLLQLRAQGAEVVQVAVNLPWGRLVGLCRRRREVARVVLERLLADVPAGARDASLVVECKARALLDAIDADLLVRSQVHDAAAELEQALLYLHDNRIVDLDKGRSVFRSAMTLRLPADAPPRFGKDDFAPLQAFYRERTLQTHVMHEYARLGASDPSAAQRLVAGYFTLDRRSFVRTFFRGRADVLALATSDASYQRIVDALEHPLQQRIVEKPERGNHLVLAGPGAGKTRVIVHRIAWLLRVRRVGAERILALAFNRGAAAQIRERLRALVGDDARGVTVLTYHALALRLTGVSLAAQAERDDADAPPVDFGALLERATRLLEGTGGSFADVDEARAELLRGWEFIFVDEYQDVDAQQYALIGALVGRRLADADAKLSLMAVGDDDQNIYGFGGANVEYLRRFQADYGCEVSHLVENFRSTRHIIDAANHVIQRAPDRMKVDHPIRIDARRADDPPGGDWETLDAADGRGRVRLVVAPADGNVQAQMALGELRRLQTLAPDRARAGAFAVLARTHAELAPLRALLEDTGLPFESIGRDAARARVPLTQVREGRRAIRLLRARRGRLVRPRALARWAAQRAAREPANPRWLELVDAWREHLQLHGAAATPADLLLDSLHEAALDVRRGGRPDAVRLATAHAAKGLEFDHVIVLDSGRGTWLSAEDQRLLYVAMTRARCTLTLLRGHVGRSPFLADLATLDAVQPVHPAAWPAHDPVLDRTTRVLTPRDVDLGWSGGLPATHPAHAHLAALRVGDPVRIAERFIVDVDGVRIGRLARAVADLPDGDLQGRVVDVLERDVQRVPEAWRARCRVERWEVALVELRGLGIKS